MTEDLRLAIQKNVPKNYNVVIIEFNKKISNKLLQQNTLFILPLEIGQSTTSRLEVRFNVYTKGSILDDNLPMHFNNFCKLASTDSKMKLSGNAPTDNFGQLTYLNSYWIVLTLPSFTNSYMIKNINLSMLRR